MLKFFSSMLCTFEIHPFSRGKYLGTSLTIGNLMIIRVTSVDVDDVAPPTLKLSDAKRHATLLSSFLYILNSLYFDVNEIISFQKSIGRLDKMSVANLSRQHHRSSDSYFKSS